VGRRPDARHPSIGFDNRAATFEMTRHLIALGHARFGLLSAPTRATIARPSAARACARRCARPACRSTTARAVWPIDLRRRAAMMREIARGRQATDGRRRDQRRVRRRRDDGVPRGGRAHPRRHFGHGGGQHRSGRDPDAAADEHSHADREIGRAAAEQVIARPRRSRAMRAYQTFPFEGCPCAGKSSQDRPQAGRVRTQARQ
jgi:hypothetical protein